jgi:O-antigen ligase
MKSLFIQNKKISFSILSVFLLIALTEIFSFMGFLHPEFRQILFLMISLLMVGVSVLDLRFGVFVVLAELFIGSKGYLFYFEHDGFLISLRIALWVILLSVWFSAFLISLIKKTKYFDFLKFLKSNNIKLLLAFFACLVWGLICALVNKNGIANIFFDFNNWLYFLLIFPFLTTLKKQKDYQKIFYIFVASSLWLIFETLVLFFIFAHDLPSTATSVYGWLRNTLVGEVNFAQLGFFRIFIQSHIYNLLAFFVITPMLLCVKDKKKFIQYFLFLCLNLTIILLSFSRSFWIGLIVGCLLLIFILIAKKYWRMLVRLFGIIFLAVIISVGLIAIILKFPYPMPLSNASAIELLKGRAGQFEDEAAVSSRWNLLPVLLKQIAVEPVVGAGFGKILTYRSNDPRILEQNSDGIFTTYAFEWGWLDIWLKLGIIGLMVYIFLMGKIFFDYLKLALENITSLSCLGICLSIAVLAIVHFFTPYINHPLGIGVILIAIAFLETKGSTDFN